MATDDQVNPEWRRDAQFKALCLEACAARKTNESFINMTPEEKITTGLGLLISYNIPTSIDMLDALHVAMEDQNFHGTDIVIRALQEPKKRIALIALAASLEEDPSHREYVEKYFVPKEPSDDN